MRRLLASLPCGFAVDGHPIGGVGRPGLVLALVEHTQGVIDDDDVLGPARTNAAVEEPGHQEGGEQHQQDAQQQQDQLFDDQAAAIAFLRFEQELHRRPSGCA